MAKVNITEERLELTAIDKTSAVLRSVEERAKALNTGYESLKATFLAVTTGTALWAWHEKLQDAQLKSETTANRMIAVLKATGGAAGLTKRQLDDYAQSLAESTQFTAGSFKAAESNLLKFGNIQQDVFKDALKLSADYAAFTGSDLLEATQAIGKALSSPAEGTRALEREIGKLNFTTKERIQTLLAEGRVTEAQGVVLEVLRRKIGGTAETMNTGLLKATTDVDKAWGELTKTIAKTHTYTGGLELTAQLLRDIKLTIEGTKNPLSDMLKDLNDYILKGKWVGWTQPEDIAKIRGRMLAEGSAPENMKPHPNFAAGRIQGVKRQQGGVMGADADFEGLQSFWSAQASLASDEIDRQREAWTKALPVVDAWRKRLMELNGATAEQIALAEVIDRKIKVGGQEFTVKAPHGGMPAGARADVLNTALGIDARNQNVQRITAEYEAERVLIERQQQLNEVRQQGFTLDRAANSEMEFQIGLIGKTVYEQQKLVALRQVDLQTRERIKQAVAALPEDPLDGDLERINRQYEEAGKRQKETVLKNLAAQRAAEREWLNGAKGAFDEYADAATNAAANVHSAFTNGLHNLEDALVAFTTTGKLSFSSLAMSAAADMARIGIRQNITGPLAAGASDFFKNGGFGFADGGVMTSSGPLPLRRYAGGGIASSPQLAMFGEGSMPEAYVPLPDGRSIPVQMRGGGSSGPTVFINAPNADAGGLARLEAMIRSLNGSIEKRSVDAIRRYANARGESSVAG